MSQSALAPQPGEAVGAPVTFNRYLPASAMTCVPDVANNHHELHWLAYVPPHGRPSFPLRTECELWRWHDGEWRSLFVAGSRFTPDELHDQGWRYCKPCEPVVALIKA